MPTSLTTFRFCSVALCLVAAPAPAQAPPPLIRSGPVFVNGMAQIVPAFQDSTRWIRQNLWVETDFDSDRDGRKDRVHVDVTRPEQTDTEGLKVPVIYSSSPYFAGTARTFAFWDVKQELGAESRPRGPMAGPAYRGDRSRISNSLVNAWVPRGFAVVHSEASGTGRSQGCPTVGDHPEIAPMKFVVDWLNGRARGFTTPTGSEEVRATAWSTGKVGMIGTSYEGTLPLAAATTGVKGLEVVIPVAPNTSYYHYYRSNGLVRSPGGYLGEDVDVLYDFVASGDTANDARGNCDRIWKHGIFAGRKGQDRASGDYNDFWAARDLLPRIKNIRSAVLLAHGLNDYNVVPSHSVRIYEAMRARGLPVSLYLHQGGHGGNPPADMINRWFTHYLYGVENGVKADPPVWIVEAPPVPRTRGAPPPPPTPAPTPFASFPAPGSEPVVLRPGRGGTGIAALTPSAGEGVDTLVDDVALSGSAAASAPQSPHRLLYATAPLTDTLRISGTARVTLRVASSQPAANLSVWLVTLPFDSTAVGAQSRVGVVTRGWADIQNHASLKRGGNYDSKRKGKPLVPGRFYDVTFDLEPDHQLIPPGKQLALMIRSSDPEFTLWPKPGTLLMVDLARSAISIPIVGGEAALSKAVASR
jgi:X-Pro dipeptidyl-peptidase